MPREEAVIAHCNYCGCHYHASQGHSCEPFREAEKRALVKSKIEKIEAVFCSAGKLFGISGGQLELVSQRADFRQRPDGSWFPVMVMRFTDHDVQFGEHKELIEGKYYELEFPLHME